MPSTYLSLHYHVVFATKRRRKIIAPAWRSSLHEYLGGTVNGLGGYSQGVGGTADHVHLLMGLKATLCLADVMRELKKASSSWVHKEVGRKAFGWQEGYGAFTVGPRGRARVRRYIANQEAHHKKRTFDEELAAFLARAEADCDPGFLD
jgi:putative transposase